MWLKRIAAAVGLAAAAFAATPTANAAAETARFAVTDVEGLENLQREFGAFKKVLAEVAGYDIEFRAVNSRTAAVEAMRAGQVDFVLTGPAEYVVFKDRSDARVVIGWQRPDYFAQVIVMADGPIKSPQDIKGKKIAFGSVGSISQHLGPAQALPDIGPQRLAEITADPCRYGFHVILKAPFRLNEEYTGDELAEAVEAFAAMTAPARADGLKLDWLDGFLALRPAGSPAQIDDLAARVVEAFEPYRALLTRAELARRRPERLDPRHRELLERYGYPHVFDEYRFHMTLTARLDDPVERAAVEREIGPWARPFAQTPFVLDAISIFEERAPGAPFRLVRRVPLSG